MPLTFFSSMKMGFSPMNWDNHIAHQWPNQPALKMLSVVMNSTGVCLHPFKQSAGTWCSTIPLMTVTPERATRVACAVRFRLPSLPCRKVSGLRSTTSWTLMQAHIPSSWKGMNSAWTGEPLWYFRLGTWSLLETYTCKHGPCTTAIPRAPLVYSTLTVAVCKPWIRQNHSHGRCPVPLKEKNCFSSLTILTYPWAVATEQNIFA